MKDKKDTENSDFKKHPAFDKKKKRNNKLSGIRQSKGNPTQMIIAQHIEHKMRIAKIFISLVCLVIIAWVINMFIQEQKRAKIKSEEILRISQNISYLDKKIELFEGYEKEVAALKAIKEVSKIVSLDVENRIKWLNKSAVYMNIIEASKPKLNTNTQLNFINRTAHLNMIHISSGVFRMGTKKIVNQEKDEIPQRKVFIAHEFWASQTEISNYQLRKIFPNHSSGVWKHYDLNKDNQPAVRVSWHEANIFCQLLTEKERKENKIPKGYEYRLPTEAEWEYMCRAGTTTEYFWGDIAKEQGAKFANTLDLKSAKIFNLQALGDCVVKDKNNISSFVGKYKPNAFNLYDMSGNVWEWCYDYYREDAYKNKIYINPVITKPVDQEITKYTKNYESYVITAPAKVIRGGSWWNVAKDVRSSARDYAPPNDKNTGIGFRPVLAPKIKKK